MRFWVKAGSGLATFGVPDSPGVPQGVAENTITLPYNDSDAVRKLFDASGDTIAAIIVEPVEATWDVCLQNQASLKPCEK